MIIDMDIDELERKLSEMDADRLRSIIISLAMDDWTGSVRDAISLHAGGPAPDGEEVRSRTVVAILSAYESWIEGWGTADEHDGTGHAPVIESVCDQYYGTVRILVDSGRGDDAASVLRTIAGTLTDPDIRWEDTVGPAAAQLGELAVRIRRCIDGGRPEDALLYRPRDD